jgi:hypothetical protein
MSQPSGSARTYNRLHTHRSYTKGKRRFSVYWTWSYPWEANRDATELDNRFSTMTEVRRGRVVCLRNGRVFGKDVSAGQRRNAGAVPSVHREIPGGCRGCHRISGRSLSAD